LWGEPIFDSRALVRSRPTFVPLVVRANSALIAAA